MDNAARLLIAVAVVLAFGLIALAARRLVLALNDPLFQQELTEYSLLDWLRRNGWRWLGKVMSASGLPSGSPPPAVEMAAITAAGETAPALAEVEQPPPPAAEPAAVETLAASDPEVSRVHLAFEVVPGARLRVTVESLDVTQHADHDPIVVVTKQAPGGKPVAVIQRADLSSPPLPARRPAAAALRLPDLGRWMSGWPVAQTLRDKLRARIERRTLSPEMTLFTLALAVYLLTRVIALDSFPIYFFSDEAIQTVQAADFVRDGFRNRAHELFPTYFQNGPYYNLSFSVYVQVIPYVLFGKTIFVTRLVSVLITAAGAVAAGLILKRFFNTPYWWSAVLLLSIVPAWFLHSRTAFEHTEMAALYAVFLYFYLSYRHGAPRHLYAACLFAALVFYTYSPGQLVILLTGALLFVVHLRYHWANRAYLARAIVLLAVLALPYARFRLAHPTAIAQQLRERDSYWVNPDLTPNEKLQQASGEYLYALSPNYWYLPNERDLKRHVMRGFGHILPITLPFAVLGVLLALKHIRQPPYHTLLIALLCAPAGAVLAEVAIGRVLVFVVPATLLTAVGWERVLQWGEQRLKWSHQSVGIGVFLVLTSANVYMLQDALRNGPVWFTDYGLGGMQYGTKQLFEEAIPSYLNRNANTQVMVSPVWANGTGVFARFFLTPDQQKRVQMYNIDYYLFDKRPLTPDTVLVMTASEYEQAQKEGKFKSVDALQTVFYPDGSPGFYFTRVAYADMIDQIFQAELIARRQPITGSVTVGSEVLQVSYSPLGAGQLKDLFDQDPFTLVRGLEANPLVFEFTLPGPRALQSVMLQVGTMDDFTLTMLAYPPGNQGPAVYTQTYQKLPADPRVEIPLNLGPAEVARLRIELKNNLAGDTAQIHVREVSWR